MTSTFRRGAVPLAALLSIGSFAPSIEAGEILDGVMSSGTMTVATNSEFPPASSLNAEGVFEGYDIDVAKEIAERLGVEAEFVNPAWEAITSGRWGGRWQIAVGSMTPTPERAKVLSFPAVYYYTPAVLYVHEDAPYQALSDVDGKRIGASAGATHEQYLQHTLTLDPEYSPPFEFQVTPGEIRGYETTNNVMDELRLGDGVRLDAGISSLPNVTEAIDAGYPLRIVGEPVFYEPLAIAASLEDPEFAEKVGGIVEDMREDGTLLRLSEQWFDEDLVTTRR